MTQRIQYLLGCDLEGGREADDVETIEYSMNGVSYEIELCVRHREMLVELNERARRTGGRRTPAPSAKHPRRQAWNAGKRLTREEAQEIRAWAREAGHEIGNNGMIPMNIRELYDNREQ